MTYEKTDLGNNSGVACLVLMALMGGAFAFGIIVGIFIMWMFA